MTISAFALITVVLLVVGGAGLKISHDDGLPQRFKGQYSSVDDNLRRERTKKYQRGNYKFYIEDKYTDNCRKIFPDWDYYDKELQCAFQRPAGENNIELIGSSHSSHLFYGLSEYYKIHSKYSIALFPVGSQLPFFNTQMLGERSNWYKRVNEAYKYVLTHDKIEYVVLSDLNRYGYSDIENPNEKDQIKILRNGVIRSFELLKNKKVLVILDNPYVPYEPALCSVRPLSFRYKESKCDYEFDKRIANQHKRVIEEVAKKIHKC